MTSPDLHSLLDRVAAAEKTVHWSDVPEDVKAMIDRSVKAYTNHDSFSLWRAMCAAYVAGLQALIEVHHDEA